MYVLFILNKDLIYEIYYISIKNFIYYVSEHYFFEVSGKGKQTFFYWRAVIQMPFFMAFHFLGKILIQKFRN